jgi:hypothetical protein
MKATVSGGLGVISVSTLDSAGYRLCASRNLFLAVHTEDGLSLWRCDRLRPCDERQYWLRMRDHYACCSTKQYSSRVQQPPDANPAASDRRTPPDLVPDRMEPLCRQFPSYFRTRNRRCVTYGDSIALIR